MTDPGAASRRLGPSRIALEAFAPCAESGREVPPCFPQADIVSLFTGPGSITISPDAAFRTLSGNLQETNVRGEASAMLCDESFSAPDAGVPTATKLNKKTGRRCHRGHNKEIRRFTFDAYISCLHSAAGFPQTPPLLLDASEGNSDSEIPPLVGRKFLREQLFVVDEATDSRRELECYAQTGVAVRVVVEWSID